ncbi:MAG: hypothetical protein ACP5HW_01995 [Candidatus Micrarchaeia archaeon]
MKYSDIERIKKIRRTLDYIAYGSLAFDAGIALITLISVHFYAKELTTALKYLNYGLTAVIVISGILFLILLYLSHYEKMIEKFAELNLRLRFQRGGNRKKQKRVIT